MENLFQEFSDANSKQTLKLCVFSFLPPTPLINSCMIFLEEKLNIYIIGHKTKYYKFWNVLCGTTQSQRNTNQKQTAQFW